MKTSESRRRHLIKQALAKEGTYDPLAIPRCEDINDDAPEMPRGIWFGEWLGKFLMSLAGLAWEFCTSLPIMQRLWRSYFVQYLHGVCVVSLGILFQKLGMLHLDEVDFVGGPAKGLTAIVTGPTSGIGTETAAALARRGATVILACRNVESGEDLKTRIERSTVKSGRDKPDIEVWKVDLSSLKSVREFSQKWESQKRPLHILINNAGIMSMGAAREETEDAFEAHMGTNHLGHFLLTLSLMPSLRRGAQESADFGPSRVVHVSSSMHLLAAGGVRKSDPHFRLPNSYRIEQAYAQSKLAQILFMKEMRRRLGPESPVQVFAVHPGMVLTNVTRTLPQWIQSLYRMMLQWMLLTPSQGSRASVFAATDKDALLEGWKSFGYFNSNCRPLQTSPAGQDMLQSQWMWKWSAEQVQLPPELDLPEAS
ncbi:hypothetical protein CEUSTIGMA_g11298.t1 [Chlamydomonas eustigma]|uniref:Uncharacterized protein n=1 Tax=Chlamydomonas eustigma TaxID=1157962 RepID=A0A250XLH3_9CHLO|nr:hypothetical protein CEUSTIGMA_g11298.t1 [Chlamydomonas eustigma]|eukprot:GAX83873.1 hypothetical protein CEUSTIGMA_g11298.t1 [Chlamydomonas eustigma]